MSSPEFVKLLEESIEIHKKKSADYANDRNPFENFDRQAVIMGWFSSDVDKAFAGIVAQKFARLAELSQPGRTPKNEAIEDTELDALTYVGLWMAYRRRARNQAIPEEVLQLVNDVEKVLNGECEAVVCRHPATKTITDSRNRLWQVCEKHTNFFR